MRVIVFMFLLCFVSIGYATLYSEGEKLSIPGNLQEMPVLNDDNTEIFTKGAEVFQTNASCRTLENISKEYLETFKQISPDADKIYEGGMQQLHFQGEKKIVSDNNFTYYLSKEIRVEKLEKHTSWIGGYELRIVDNISLEIIYTQKLPEHLKEGTLSLKDSILIFTGSGIPKGNLQKQYMGKQERVFIVAFDVSNPYRTKFVKSFVSDGKIKNIEIVDDNMYILSHNNLSSYYTKQLPELQDIQMSEMIPQGIEVVATDNEEKQNLILNNKKYKYNLSKGYVSKCSDVHFLKGQGYQELYQLPKIFTLHTIDLNDIYKEVKSDTFFGAFSDIYMSGPRLYVIENINKTESFRCESSMNCIGEYHQGGLDYTKLYKIDLEALEGNRYNSVLFPGKIIDGEGIYEKDGNIMLTTLTTSWKGGDIYQHLNFLALDASMDKISELKSISKTKSIYANDYSYYVKYAGDYISIDTYSYGTSHGSIILNINNLEEPIVGKTISGGMVLHTYNDGFLAIDNSTGFMSDPKEGTKIKLYNSFEKCENYAGGILKNTNCNNKSYQLPVSELLLASPKEGVNYIGKISKIKFQKGAPTKLIGISEKSKYGTSNENFHDNRVVVLNLGSDILQKYSITHTPKEGTNELYCMFGFSKNAICKNITDFIQIDDSILTFSENEIRKSDMNTGKLIKKNIFK